MTVGASPFSTGKVVDFTRSIELIPNQFGYISSLNLFAGEGLVTDTAIIDIIETAVGVLPVIQRGSPATRLKQGTVKQLPVIVPHHEVEDFIFPKDVHEVRRPGSTEEDLIARVRAQKMNKLSLSLDQTLEYYRLSAIKGITKGIDSNGTPVTLFDAYTELGVSEVVVDIDFTDSAEDVPGKIRSIKRSIELGAKAGGITPAIRCICSATWFDAFISHAKIVDAYQMYASRQEPLRNDVRRDFEYMGIVFSEYNGSLTLAGGASEALVAADTAHFFPVGISDMYLEYYSPDAERLQYVGTRGILKYAFQYANDEDKYIKISAVSNPIMLCTRPAALVRCRNHA